MQFELEFGSRKRRFLFEIGTRKICHLQLLVYIDTDTLQSLNHLVPLNCNRHFALRIALVEDNREVELIGCNLFFGTTVYLNKTIARLRFLSQYRHCQYGNDSQQNHLFHKQFSFWGYLLHTTHSAVEIVSIV